MSVASPSLDDMVEAFCQCHLELRELEDREENAAAALTSVREEIIAVRARLRGHRDDLMARVPGGGLRP